jgi:xanthine phosphoribosyltransferase
MQTLKERILRDGLALGTEIVKVDSFLNHQIDVAFLERLGEDMGRRFAEERVDKILTVEASGIAVACMCARRLAYPPVVFAKKTTPGTMTGDFYGAEVMSFTKKTVSTIRISKDYLSAGEHVLIIDDFLAHGEAAVGLTRLVEQANAHVVGVGVVIEKKFQGGARRLRERGFRVESLAVIEKIEDGKIFFEP